MQKAIEGEYLPAQDTAPVLAATEENKRKAAINIDMFSRVARHRWYELDKLSERQRHLIRQQEQLARQQSDLIAEQHQLEQQLSAINTTRPSTVLGSDD
ncbi:hypothetical protein [Oceanospirillum maris]|uniref:hypothetical protein n=1 Tax=Oceanospirillum maris TaxID=64977 RepID=UPI0003F6A826|nr:hypothetical protein [Oceanospirillum maris]